MLCLRTYTSVQAPDSTVLQVSNVMHVPFVRCRPARYTTVLYRVVLL